MAALTLLSVFHFSVNDSDPIAGILGIVIFAILCLAGFLVYMIPTILAIVRSHPNVLAIAVVNLLLGWLCLGWIVALVWSVSAIDESRSYR